MKTLRFSVTHRHSIFESELYFENHDLGNFQSKLDSGYFDILFDGRIIYRGSRVTGLYFGTQRVEVKFTKRKWQLKIGLLADISISYGSKKGVFIYYDIEINGHIVGRICHSSKWLYCSRKYSVTCKEESKFDLVLFAFSFYLNENARTYTI